LKHGISVTDEKTKSKEVEKVEFADSNFKAISSKDPYDFPEIQDTVAMYLTKNRFPRMIDEGDRYEKPGRKFGYTEDDFLMSYLGKDYARPANLDVE
jgi:hypothetical protein